MTKERPIDIDYLDKAYMEPFYGYAYPLENRVEIRDDLEGALLDFVKAHELFHVKDEVFIEMLKNDPDNMLKRIKAEIRANMHAFKLHTWGGIKCLFFTVFSFSRLWWYFKYYVLRQ